MDEKSQPFKSTLFRASLSLVLASIAAQMTLIPFLALVYLATVLPEWEVASAFFIGIFSAIFAGYKSFRWFYRYLGSLR